MRYIAGLTRWKHRADSWSRCCPGGRRRASNLPRWHLRKEGLHVCWQPALIRSARWGYRIFTAFYWFTRLSAIEEDALLCKAGASQDWQTKQPLTRGCVHLNHSHMLSRDVCYGAAQHRLGDEFGGIVNGRIKHLGSVCVGNVQAVSCQSHCPCYPLPNCCGDDNPLILHTPDPRSECEDIKISRKDLESYDSKNIFRLKHLSLCNLPHCDALRNSLR